MAIAVLIGIGAVTYRSTLKLAETARWVTHIGHVLKTLDAIMASLHDVETGQRGYAITGDDTFLQPYHSGTGKLGGMVGKVRSLTSDNERQVRRIAALDPLIAQRLAFAKEVIEARKSGTFEMAQDLILSGRGLRLMEDAAKVLQAMEDDENGLLEKRKAEADAWVVWTKNIIVFGGLGAALLLSLAGWSITRNIARPLGEVTAAAGRIADGDINVEFASDGRDDEVGVLMQTFQRMCRSLAVLAGRARQIAEGDLTTRIEPRSEGDVLGNAFAAMVANLRHTMDELSQATNVLASSAHEILTSTTQLAASAAQTAATVAETTATVDEVKQTSQVSSQKAKSVADEAQKAAEVARGGKAAVEQTIEGMSGIREQMGAVAESILSLSAQGHAIGEIISTVDDLAAQSRLLAVNASIEAAKAGEEGKGFAVVAQEVRSLAEQSKLATQQVRAILNDIQKATGSAVLTTEQGSKLVEVGVLQSASSGESIRALAESVAAAAQASRMIAATSQQQFVGMDQVAMAMESIKAASTQTVASTKQAEAAAHQLHELGQKLRQIVGRFKVADPGPGGPSTLGFQVPSKTGMNEPVRIAAT